MLLPVKPATGLLVREGVAYGGGDAGAVYIEPASPELPLGGPGWGSIWDMAFIAPPPQQQQQLAHVLTQPQAHAALHTHMQQPVTDAGLQGQQGQPAGPVQLHLAVLLHR